MKKLILWILFAATTISSGAALAGGGGSFAGATEYTQIMNNVQLADGYAQDALRYQNEIMRYELMVKGLLDNPLGVTGPNLQLLIDNQAKIMAYGSAIGQSMSQVDKNVARAFNNPNASSFGVKFGVTANMALDQLKAAMLNMGLQHDNAQTDSQNIGKLVEKVRVAQGDKGAIQALGELNAAQLQEAQQYRQLFAEQSQAVNLALGADIMQKRDAQTQADNMQAGFDSAASAATVDTSTSPRTYKKWNLYSPK